VAQGRDVLLGIASSVNPIAAVMVRLSLVSLGAISAVMVRLSLVPVNMAISVGAIAAVMVRLSLGHGQSMKGQVEVAVAVIKGGGVGVSRMGVAVITKVAPGEGVSVTTDTAGPQEAKNNKIMLTGNNSKMLGYVLFMVPRLPGDYQAFYL